MEATRIDKFKALVSESSSGWLEKAKWRAKNEDWLDVSFQVATRVLKALREKNMTQKDLSELLEVTPQQVSKILKGTENLTLETITRIERALQIDLVKVPKHTLSNRVAATDKYSPDLPVAYKTYRIPPVYHGSTTTVTNLSVVKSDAA